jgi:hypothetical protein
MGLTAHIWWRNANLLLQMATVESHLGMRRGDRWGTIVAGGAQLDIGGATAGGPQDAPGETTCFSRFVRAIKFEVSSMVMMPAEIGTSAQKA